MRRSTASAGELFVGQPLASNAAHGEMEATEIRPSDPVIETEALFSEVTVKMEWLNSNVGSRKVPLHERPEAFEAVGVNLSANILHGVIDRLVNVVLLKPGVSHGLIGVDPRTWLDGAHNFFLKSLALDVRHYFRPNLAALTVQHADDRSLVREAVLVLLYAWGPHRFVVLGPLALMPVLRIAANERLIHFDRAGTAQRPLHRVRLHCLTRPVKHEPSGLLSDADGPCDLVAANAVLAVRQHPHDHHPLVEFDGGILKDRSDLEAELLVAAVAHPDPPGLDERVLFRPAARARHQSVRPPEVDRVGKGSIRVGKVNDGILQCFRHVHDSNATPNLPMCQVCYYR